MSYISNGEEADANKHNKAFGEVKVTLEEIKNLNFLRGYIEAVTDFGIWQNGTQVIGCLNTPVKEIITKKMAEFGYTPESFKGDE